MVRALLFLLAAWAGLISGQAAAQSWPLRPVRIIVTFPPGGSSDMVARLLAERMTQVLQQRFVVENRSGAGGTIAALYVSQQSADGYALMLSNSAPITTSPPLYPQAGYDPVHSFTHVTYIGAAPVVIVVNPRIVPVADLPGLITWIGRQPQPPSFGTSGNGTVGHILGELFQRQAGVRLNHVPYRGSVGLMPDLLGGAIPIAIDTLPQYVEPFAAGQLRGVGVASVRRSPIAPGVETTREGGFPYLLAENWFGISGPAGLPAAVVEQLNAGVMVALEASAVRERLREHAVTVQPQGPAEFAAFVARDVSEIGGVIRQLGIRLQ